MLQNVYTSSLPVAFGFAVLPARRDATTLYTVYCWTLTVSLTAAWTASLVLRLQVMPLNMLFINCYMLVMDSAADLLLTYYYLQCLTSDNIRRIYDSVKCLDRVLELSESMYLTRPI